VAKDFVKEHINEEWFKEKYDPSISKVTKGKIVEHRKWLYEVFMKDLDEGKFDTISLDLDKGKLRCIHTALADHT